MWFKVLESESFFMFNSVSCCCNMLLQFVPWCGSRPRLGRVLQTSPWLFHVVSMVMVMTTGSFGLAQWLWKSPFFEWCISQTWRPWEASVFFFKAMLSLGATQCPSLPRSPASALLDAGEWKWLCQLNPWRHQRRGVVVDPKWIDHDRSNLTSVSYSKKCGLVFLVLQDQIVVPICSVMPYLHLIIASGFIPTRIPYCFLPIPRVCFK